MTKERFIEILLEEGLLRREAFDLWEELYSGWHEDAVRGKGREMRGVLEEHSPYRGELMDEERFIRIAREEGFSEEKAGRMTRNIHRDRITERQEAFLRRTFRKMIMMDERGLLDWKERKI